MKLWATITPTGAKNISGYARRMHSDDHWLVTFPPTFYQCHMYVIRIDLFKRDKSKVTEACRHVDFDIPTNKRLFLNPIFNEVFYGNEFKPKAFGHFLQIRKARHRTVFIHNLHQYT